MIKMKLGKIYKIISPSTDRIYVGSTVKTIEERLEEHERDYGGWLSRGCRKCYLTSFEILKYGDYKIELIEDVIDGTLLNHEKAYINNNDCVNILHNKFTEIEKFNCVCGKEVLSVHRYKHCKSALHRKILREIHSELKNKSYFIQKYRKSQIIVTQEPGKTITIL